MVARRVTGTQLSHARDRKEPAPGLIVKRPEDAPDYDKACRSYNHFDHEHPFEPHDPWYDHGHTRAGRPQVKRQEEDRSTASTVIASILVKTTATGHCDIEIKDVDGKIVDHLPCVQERLQSLSTRPHMAGKLPSIVLRQPQADSQLANASGRTLPGTEPEHHGHQSPRRSLRHSQRITPRASRIFNAASLRRPAAPALIQRRRGDSRSTRNQQDQRMPSATHKTYMSGGQLRIGNLDALHNFFYYRFWILEQNPCKKIIKHLVDAIVPKKQTQLPYQGKPKQGRTAAHLPDTRTVKTPGFWPPGIPYTGPDRAQRSGMSLCVLEQVCC